MYAETQILPYFRSFTQQFDDFCKSQIPSPSVTSMISEYDLGGEGDLFKAPKAITEEPLGSLEHMAAAMSMISGGNDDTCLQGFEPSDMDSFDNEQLFNKIFYECENNLLEREAIEFPLPAGMMNEDALLPGAQFQKSVSSGCLSSMDWIHSSSTRQPFLDFPGMGFGSAYGMRRAYSEGDIKSTLERPVIISNCTSEERKEKVSRYRNKKTKRNFGRKIKYACRKALADSQPRVRGRFAKIEESDIAKR